MNWFAQIFDPAAVNALLIQVQAEIAHPQFWVSLLKIIWINVLLSGDNALVIALACRGLEPQQRVWGLVLGAGVAVLLRIIFTFIVVTLLALPFLKLIGGIALLIIAAKLLVPDHQDDDNVQAAAHLWAAVRIVAVADIIMSLDNVIAVAAAADGSVTLLVLGLLISIPMIVAGAALIMTLLDRLPALVWFGAALLGWIAGEVIATDPVILPWLHKMFGGRIGFDIDAASATFGVIKRLQWSIETGEFLLAVSGVILVLVAGSIWRQQSLQTST